MNKEEKRAYQKAYREAHKEEIKAYYEAHKKVTHRPEPISPEEFKKKEAERLREYRKKNKESYNEKNRARMAEMRKNDEYRDKENAQKKAYYETHKEERRAYKKAYYEAHKETIKAQDKKERRTQTKANYKKNLELARMQFVKEHNDTWTYQQIMSFLSITKNKLTRIRKKLNIEPVSMKQMLANVQSENDSLRIEMENLRNLCRDREQKLLEENERLKRQENM